MRDELARRRALLTAALGFTRIRWRQPAPSVVATLTRWIDSWRGVGAVAVGMTTQGFNLELKEFPNGWRANFYSGGSSASPGPLEREVRRHLMANTRPRHEPADLHGSYLSFT